MTEVAASIISALDKISLKAERLQEAVITKMEKKRPKIFQVVVLSGAPERTNNSNRGSAHGNTPSGNTKEPLYYFSRVRRLVSDRFEKPDPFLEKNPNKARQLANMHPIGVLLQSAGRSPQEGELWSCRYLTEDKQGIVLMKREGISKGFLALGAKESIYQSSALGWKGETLNQYVQADTAQTTGLEGYPAPLARYYVGTNSRFHNQLVYNGSFPQELLGVSNEGTTLVKETVSYWNNLEHAFFQQFGFKLGKAGGVRSYKKQIEAKKNHIAKGTPNYAATPGTSKHGWGLAADWGVRDANGAKVKGDAQYDSVTYKWMLANAPRFGFHNPPWARRGASGPDEPWHFEWIKFSSIIKKSQYITGGET